VRLNSTLSKDLLNNLVFVAGAELVLELRLAGGVQNALLAVPITIASAIALSTKKNTTFTLISTPTWLHRTRRERQVGCLLTWVRTQEP
jgi:hypothetical protein